MFGVSAEVIEEARAESERVRVALVDKKKGSTESDHARVRADLKAAIAKIKRLELKLAECLGTK